MNLSPELQQRFDEATARQNEYRPADGVRKVIKDKTLVMIVAPAAMGKSYIISHTIATDPQFAQTISFTTRDPRSGDEGNMRTIPPSEQHISTLLQLIEAGQVVNYAIFPTTGMLYGTDLMSYPGKINLLPTQSHSVDTLRRTGFGHSVTIGLVTHPDTWKAWFEARYPSPSSEKSSRLKEGVLSLSWLLQDGDVRWLINRDGHGDKTVAELIELSRARGAAPNEEAEQYAQQLRSLMTQMLQ